MSEPQPQSVADELKRLLKQSSHYLTALVINLGLGFISFPIFTRVFSVADFGTIDLVQKIFLLLTAAAKLGQQNAALRFYHRENFAREPQQARSYYSTLYLSVLGIGAAVTLLFAGTLSVLPGGWLAPALSGMLVFASSLILLRSLQSMLWAFLRIQERTAIFNLANVFIRGASIAVILLLIPWLGASVRTYFTATIGVELAVVIVLTIPLIYQGAFRIGSFDTVLFKTAIVFGAPLVIQELAGIILDAGDRILIQIYLGADALGFYSVAYGLSSYVNTLLNAPLGLAILPIYMRIWNSDGREKTTQFLSIGLDYFLMAAALLLAVVSVCAHDAVVVLASAKYRGADSMIPTLVAGLLIYTVGIFTTAGLVIEGKTKILATTLVFSAGLNVVLNMVLLPLIGLNGAAIATLISYVFCALYQAKVAFRVLPLTLHYKSIAIYVVAAVAAMLAGGAASHPKPIVSLLLKAVLSTITFFVILLGFDRKKRQLAGRGIQSVQKISLRQRSAVEARP